MVAFNELFFCRGEGGGPNALKTLTNSINNTIHPNKNRHYVFRLFNGQELFVYAILIIIRSFQHR
jgi:hypothetical protein